MKRIEQALERGAGYCILFLTLASLFANHQTQALTFGEFYTVIGLGLVIAIVEFLYSIIHINPILKMILHYVVLLGIFLFIFILGSGYIKEDAGVAGLFIAIIIFTLCYFTFYFIIKLVRSTIEAADKALDKMTEKNAKSKKGKSSNKNSAYTPRFKK